MSSDAYRLWYEYLKETNHADWTDGVWEDFGGVLTKSFEEWFDLPTRLKLFALHGMDRNKLPVRCLNEEDSHIDIDRDTHMVLVVDLSCPLDQLMKKIELQIKVMKEDRKSGRPAWKPSHAKYPFARKPDISSLEIALAAHRLKKTGITNWEVGNELAKTFPILQAQRIKEGDLDSVSKQKVLESAVSRYLKTAEAVLAGVVCGIFPAK